jgi:hypothetical protein
MPMPARLSIVQRQCRDLYERVRAQRGPAADVIIDRRRGERRIGEVYTQALNAASRIGGARRRLRSAPVWTEVHHVIRLVG